MLIRLFKISPFFSQSKGAGSIYIGCIITLGKSYSGFPYASVYSSVQVLIQEFTEWHIMFEEICFYNKYQESDREVFRFLDFSIFYRIEFSTNRIKLNTTFFQQRFCCWHVTVYKFGPRIYMG